jgi:NitT/TauT family transport system permease protein
MASDLLANGKAEAKTISGLDALEIASRQKVTTRAGRAWAGFWPKLAALALAIGLWQVVAWTDWKPDYALPGPAAVFGELWAYAKTAALWDGLAITLRRAAVGFAAAVAVGLVVGLAVARSRVLRAAIGSMITALQTMPSIAWFPLAILLFQLSEQAIFFVVVLGAAPSIANGVIYGLDYIPPLLLRAGRNLGARGFSLYRHVIVPAALPAIMAGLKQGWAFAWRSLLAGELLVTFGVVSIGSQLDLFREVADSAGLLAIMIVILVIGIVIDSLVFGTLDRWVRRRHGLAGD